MSEPRRFRIVARGLTQEAGGIPVVELECVGFDVDIDVEERPV